MRLTGNPFVDAGLGIAAGRVGHASIEALSPDDLRKSVSDLHREAARLKKFNVLASYWLNNPFMGKNLPAMPKYDRFLNNLASGSLPTRLGHCQVCGISPVIAQEADRSWFPLAGGRNSDPCTLPGLRGKSVCPDCMSAIIILPLGCRLCPEGPYFVHVTEPDLQVRAVANGVEVLKTALLAGSSDAVREATPLRGRAALLDIASGSLLWDHRQPCHMDRVPRSGATMIAFSNNGQAARFHQLHLPAQALEFLGAIAVAGIRQTFRDWARLASKSRHNDWLDELCRDVEERRSLAPLLVAIVSGRKYHQISKEECKVLEIYEGVALNKKERFDTLQRVATKIRVMPERYSNSFIKQLSNVASKGALLDLFKKFCKNDSAGLDITPSELRVMDGSSSSETASLLYLLCIATEDGEQR